MLELRHVTTQLSRSMLAAFPRRAGSFPSHVVRHVTATFTSCVPLLHPLLRPLLRPLLHPLSFPSL